MSPIILLIVVVVAAVAAGAGYFIGQAGIPERKNRGGRPAAQISEKLEISC